MDFGFESQMDFTLHRNAVSVRDRPPASTAGLPNVEPPPQMEAPGRLLTTGLESRGDAAGA